MSEQARRIFDRIARGLVLAITAVALIVGSCAFLDGREYRDGSRVDAGGFAIAMFLISLLAPGLLVWRRPQPKFVWAWAIVGWITGLVYAVFIMDTRYHGETAQLWPLRVVETGSLIGAALVMLGTPLIAFSMSAAAVRPDPSAPALARRLRRFTRLVVALGVATAACGFLPGARVYEDSRNCLGNAIGSLFTEAHSTGCTSSYDQLVATHMAGGLWLLLYLLLALAPAILVYADPRSRRAWQWMSWSILTLIPAGVMYVQLEFPRSMFAHTETLHATHLVELGICVLQLLLMLVLPLITLTARDQIDPPLPQARIHHDY